MSSTVDALRVVVKTGGTEFLSDFLKSCDDSRVFSQSKEAAAVVALTNGLLNENSTRREGLMILKCLVAQLPTEELRVNFLSWLQQTMRGLSQKDSSSTVNLSAEVMNSLIAMSPMFVDIRKEIALNLSKKILEVLYELKDSQEFLVAVLTPLQTILDKYGKGVISWKDRLSVYLLSLIEDDEHSVNLASRCYLNLAKCGIPGNDSVLHKEGWTNQFNSLISSLHQILNRLFENVNEIRSEKSSLGAPLQHLPNINENISTRKMQRLTSQFLGLSQFLETMLLGPFPVSKRVSPELVFGVICRGLAVTLGTLHAQVTSETDALIAQIPRLHTTCLSLLTTLIKSCKVNLISWGPVICKLISQVLKTRVAEENVYGHHKPYRSIRKAAYNCLMSWLSVANCSSTIEKYPDIIDSIVSDIQFKPPSVTLNLSCKMLKGKMGKKQRQTLINSTLDRGELNIIDKEANKDVCLAALQTVPLLLECASVFLPPESYKRLQDVVCNELISTQLNTGDKVPLPYTDNSCRLELYKCFVAFCHNNHPSCSPPIALAPQLIGKGHTDPCDKIVHYCTVALTTVDKILRPIGPTLCVPVELPNSTFQKKRVNFELPLVETTTTSNEIDRQNSSIDLPLVEVFQNGDASFQGDGNSRSPVNSTLEDSLLVDSEMSEFDYADDIKETPLISSSSLIGSKYVDDPQAGKSSTDNVNSEAVLESIENKRKLESDDNNKGGSENKRVKQELLIGELHSEVSSTVNNLTADSENPNDMPSTESAISSEGEFQKLGAAGDIPTTTIASDLEISDGLEIEMTSKDGESNAVVDNEEEAEMLSSFVDDVI